MRARSVGVNWDAPDVLAQYRCRAKVTFPSRKVAAGRAMVIGSAFRHYKCAACRGWHVAHKASRRARLRTEEEQSM